MPFAPCLTSFWLAGSERFGQVVPELEEPRVEHDEDAADIARAVLVEEQRAFRRVKILRGRTVALTFQESHCNERIEKVRDGTRVEF